MEKNIARLRRAKSTRAHIRKLEVVRLSVHRSNQHLYAQVFSASGDHVIAAASTLQESINADLKAPRISLLRLRLARRWPNVVWPQASTR